MINVDLLNKFELNNYLQLLLVTTLAFVVVVWVNKGKQHSTSKLKLKNTRLNADKNFNKLIFALVQRYKKFYNYVYSLYIMFH